MSIFTRVSKTFFSAVYDKKYISGRWFEESVMGYKWCWRAFFSQKILRKNGHIPWPVSGQIVIGNADNLLFHVDDLNNFQHFGCYFQNYKGKIYLGKGTYIAPNVGIITQNHDLNDLSKHQKAKDVVIGKECWIGMNAVILPGVVLGDNTIVGAGSVVTKSFESGNCVVAGNPARTIKSEVKMSE
jgi:acetyltransferase-like isoleucine patch superfamily enzyme